MQTSAWIFMLTAWTIVTGLTIRCFVKILKSKATVQTEEDGSPDRPEPWGAPPTLRDG